MRTGRLQPYNEKDYQKEFFNTKDSKNVSQRWKYFHRSGRMRKNLKRLLPRYDFKVKRIFNPKAKRQDNHIWPMQESPLRETYAQGVVDPRPVKSGWYPHIRDGNAWRPVFLRGSYKNPRVLYWFRSNRKKGKARKLTRIELDIDLEIQRGLKE